MVRQVSKPGLIGRDELLGAVLNKAQCLIDEHGDENTNGLVMRRLRDIDLLEGNRVFRLQAESIPMQDNEINTYIMGDFVCMMLLDRLQLNGCTVADNLLNGDLNELVERIELLPHESLLDEVCVDDEPAGGLPLGGREGLLEVVVGVELQVVHGKLLREYELHTAIQK